MCNRRNKPICQGAVFLALVGGLGYTIYLYSTISMDLEISKSETEKYLRQQESLSSQLQVVYEHRARLERSLQKEKTDHKNTKMDFSKKQNDFILNITRSKHEAMNRFNSLETQYNMLMAQNKELNTDYNRLRQQYTRLSSEQSQLNNQLKRNFQLYKEQKTNEIASLDEEIKTLKQQVVSLRTHLKSRADEVEQYKLSSSQAVLANKKYQETISTLQEQLASYKEKLREFQLRIDESKKDVKHDKGRKTAESRQQGGKPLDSVNGEVDQGEKEKTYQERESHPGPSKNDRRHPAKGISQDGYHGQTYVPSTFSNDTDSKDENNDKQKQDVGEKHSDQRQDNVPLRSREERKQNENSQIESEQRHDNVLLKDSNINEDIRDSDKEPGVQVVAPTENSMNKWANIIKSSQQNNAPEGGKTEDNDKGEEEEGEEQENEEIRNRRSVDDYRQEVNDNFRLQDSDLQRYNQKQPDEERGKQIGRPVSQARKNGDGRLEEPGYHSDNAQRAQDQYEDRNPERQQQEVNDNNEEEVHERDQDGHESDFSRKNINKQVAEMQEQYDKKQIQQHQQQQRDIMTLPTEQGGDVRQRSVYRQVAPIPAVRHRQDTAEGHKEQSDADNDDEDADTEVDTEQDPDDADEDVLEPQELPQEQLQLPQQGQGQPHQGRTYDRTLKSADSNINYQQNE